MFGTEFPLSGTGESEYRVAGEFFGHSVGDGLCTVDAQVAFSIEMRLLWQLIFRPLWWLWLVVIRGRGLLKMLVFYVDSG